MERPQDSWSRRPCHGADKDEPEDWRMHWRLSETGGTQQGPTDAGLLCAKTVYRIPISRLGAASRRPDALFQAIRLSSIFGDVLLGDSPHLSGIAATQYLKYRSLSRWISG